MWDETQYAIDEITKVTGLPPNDIIKFSAKNVTDKDDKMHPKVKISFTSPNDTIIDGNLLCKVGGVRVVRKENSAPENPEDGIIIIDGSVGTVEILDETPKPNMIYYYSFFPYSDHGVFNYNSNNYYIINTDTGIIEHIYGFDQDLNDENQNTSITYPEDVENSSYKSLDDWYDFFENILGLTPCMVHSDGTFDYELDKRDFKKKKNGEPSDFNNNDYDGGAFVWMNCIWIQETFDYGEDNSKFIRKVRFCDIEKEGYTPVGFFKRDNTVAKGLWLAMMPLNTSGKVIENEGWYKQAHFMPDQNLGPNYKGIYKTAYQGLYWNLNPFASIELARKTYPDACLMSGPIWQVFRDIYTMAFKFPNVYGYNFHNILNDYIEDSNHNYIFHFYSQCIGNPTFLVFIDPLLFSYNNVMGMVTNYDESLITNDKSSGFEFDGDNTIKIQDISKMAPISGRTNYFCYAKHLMKNLSNSDKALAMPTSTESVSSIDKGLGQGLCIGGRRSNNVIQYGVRSIWTFFNTDNYIWYIGSRPLCIDTVPCGIYNDNKGTGDQVSPIWYYQMYYAQKGGLMQFYTAILIPSDIEGGGIE